ncbi:phosphatase PAP2 family protein [Candidatus Parcubacteria bacterium]|nr:MAG: phosphatase PAP2 family protein [Candidatus Parcubacteria bacterium]
MNAFDFFLFEWLNGLVLRWPWFDAVVILAGKKLPYGVGIAFAVLFLLPIFPRFRQRAWKNLEMFFVALGGAIIARLVVAGAIRYFYDRPRPFEVVDNARQLIDHAIGASFPSGHAVFFFALAAGIWPYYKKTSAAFFGAAMLVSIGRIMGGVHWPSDIIAGAILGIATTGLLVMATRRIRSES